MERLYKYTLHGMKVASAKATNTVNESQKTKPQVKTYNDLKENEIEEFDTKFALRNEQTMQWLDLENRVQIDCSRTKNIISTQINGQIGTIKEWINNGDVAINLLITIINKDNTENYPEDELKEIIEFLNMNKELKVYNKYLNDIMGITRIVVTSYKHTTKMYQGVQTISVDALSDDTYIIEEELLK